jgi:hypothetical protein
MSLTALSHEGSTVNALGFWGGFGIAYLTCLFGFKSFRGSPAGTCVHRGFQGHIFRQKRRFTKGTKNKEVSLRKRAGMESDALDGLDGNFELVELHVLYRVKAPRAAIGPV